MSSYRSDGVVNETSDCSSLATARAYGKFEKHAIYSRYPSVKTWVLACGLHEAFEIGYSGLQNRLPLKGAILKS
jgi:hypothetical protein